MAIWEKDNEEQDLHDVIEKAFGRYPEGCVLEPYMVEQIQQGIMAYFEKRIVRSFRLKGE